MYWLPATYNALGSACGAEPLPIVIKSLSLTLLVDASVWNAFTPSSCAIFTSIFWLEAFKLIESSSIFTTWSPCIKICALLSVTFIYSFPVVSPRNWISPAAPIFAISAPKVKLWLIIKLLL